MNASKSGVRGAAALLAAVALTATAAGVLRSGGDAAVAPQGDATLAVTAYAGLPLAFEPDLGQAGDGEAFLARGRGYGLSVEPAAARLRLTGPEGTNGPDVRLSLVGADPAAAIAGTARLPGTVNHFVGDRSQWRTGIPTYARVTSTGVYPGVDMVWYGNQGELEYDFVVAPGADPGRIAVALDGAERITLGPGGDLVLDTPGGRVVQRPPVVYQQAGDRRDQVAARYALDGNRVRFSLGAYDAARPLVIDPVLSYSSYLGSTGDDIGEGVAVDGAGQAHVVGTTTSTTFPTASPIQANHAGGALDAFVTKMNATGSALLYSTYLGGTGFDGGAGVALDGAGNSYVVGSTGSADFPTTAGAHQEDPGGAEDAFVTKLSPAGALVYSTYVGGTSSDQGEGIAVDPSGQAVLAGGTFSDDFPITGPVQVNRAGDFDAFVTKLSAAGSGRIYSTYLGGTTSDRALSVAADSGGNAVVTGFTFGGFPTANPQQPNIAGSFDAFVAKLPASGAPLSYSTYLGGGRHDEGRDVAVDTAGNAYVTGATESNNFPTTVGAYDTGRGGPEDVFVTKLSTAGVRSYSTYAGGSNFTDDPEGGGDEGTGIAVDEAGAAHVTGLTHSSNFPLLDPVQGAVGSFDDAFAFKLNPAGSGLEYSTYLGGTGIDEGRDIAVGGGAAYLTGGTASPAGATPVPFPTTPGAFQTTQPGARSAFVTKLGTTAEPEGGAVADFDGDGDTDFSVFRPSAGFWFVQNGAAAQFGTSGDIPVPGDYDGDGDTDFAVFRPSTGFWFVQNGAAAQFGTSGDIPVPGDYDGDGDTDFAVFRPSTGFWFVQNGPAAQFGTSGDIPVPGDYDGDGDTDFAVFRPSTGFWFVNGGPAAQFGTSGDIPVPGDYDGDGDTDFAVFRPSTGFWFVNGGPAAQFGTSGDIPVPGDYDGDGDTDFAVFRPSTGFWFVNGGPAAPFGTSGDVPLPLAPGIRLAFFP